jgi:hypothetical protein
MPEVFGTIVGAVAALFAIIIVGMFVLNLLDN